MNITGCLIDYRGTKKYFVNGKLHRTDGPAIECANGDKAYYINGELHREDGPAIEHSNGGKEYYINGKRHCEDGYKAYYLNNKKVTIDDLPIELNRLRKENAELKALIAKIGSLVQ